MQLQENTMFANRYQLLRLLGRGGFSEVWLAKDSYTKLEIALKIYAPGQGMDSDGLQEFSQELAGVFNLNHTNLLKPTHVDSWEGMPYLIMSYCSHGSLAKRAKQLTEQELWHVIRDVAAGLSYLHKNDIVHQDIKPDNILQDENGNYVITDFGISTRARSTLRKSMIGGSLSGGTMAYMGPERFSRQPAPTKASDIWSFGAMMFELLTGDVPFGEMGGGLQKGGAEIPYIAADCSDALKYTIYKMLSKETWDRPVADVLIAWSQNPQAIEIEEDVLVKEESEYDAPKVEQKKSSARKTQHISSRPQEAILVSEDKLEISFEANKYHTIKVTSDTTWYLSTDSTDWLHCQKKNESELVLWADENTRTERRAAHIYINNESGQKSVLVTQAGALKTIAQRNELSKKSKWAIALSIIFFVLCMGGIISHIVSVNEEKQYLKIQHDDVRSEIDRYVDAATLDDYEALGDAINLLSDLQEIEENKRYDGYYMYLTYRTKVSNKVDELYELANGKYQRAPEGTQAKTRNKQKRDQLAGYKARLN